ncbi:hypothetical protein MN116_002828 [Schistosoma mekongi]|uniref:Protein TBATA n=1 Tax=Schistosoma mekongi TaxID=38744 RepID=A0AAE1ZGJ5_SCHME|nr:hypothetical protein MN116_002828 [Schistosoma mekongi]
MSNYIHDVMNHIPDYSGRHNPHPHRVTHFTGFLGLPVRVVNDPILTDDNIPLNQRKDDYNTSLELKKRINFPIGLSPSYYTDFLVNNSLKLNLKVNHDLSNRSWKSNYCLHHVPVGILPLSQTYRKIPQLDTINGLKYFTGLQNYSVRERPPLIGSLIESELSSIKDAKQSGEYSKKSKYTSLFNRQLSEHRMKWQNELGYLTGSILNQLQIPILNDDNYDEHVYQFHTSLNRNSAYHLPSSLEKKSLFRSNYQLPETITKNHSASSELLYSRKTGRLLPPCNNNRYTRSRNQTSGCERSQCLKNTSSVNELFRNYEIQIFAMICSILQTNDVSAVQHWLENATDREKNLIISLVSTALSHQSMYFDTKQFGGNFQKTNSEIQCSRSEKLSNNETCINGMEDKNVQNCCTTIDRLVIGEVDNVSETHSRGVQANLSCSTYDNTLKSEKRSEVDAITNNDECSSLCQIPIKPNWKQHESIGIP